ncbi:MAG: cyclic nucleotide-binding domain-containing protein [Gammaproteobacteria bacterium]|nr:cyclic nucleotide-binding domain-containing protein [Gammaproteobacteria bacterium]
MAEGKPAPIIELDIRKAVISAQPSFAGLTPEETETLAKLLDERQVAVDEAVVKEGDLIDSVYFILEGEADVRHITYENAVQKIESVATLKTGGTIGLNDRGFFSLTGRRTATVVALTPMFLLKLRLSVFHGFALVNPHVNKVMREHAARILQMRG